RDRGVDPLPLVEGVDAREQPLRAERAQRRSALVDQLAHHGERADAIGMTVEVAEAVEQLAGCVVSHGIPSPGERRRGRMAVHLAQLPRGAPGGEEVGRLDAELRDKSRRVRGGGTLRMYGDAAQ